MMGCGIEMNCAVSNEQRSIIEDATMNHHRDILPDEGFICIYLEEIKILDIITGENLCDLRIR
jgi:hypothetical protein